MAYDEDYIPPIQITPASETPEEQTEILEQVEFHPGFARATQLLLDCFIREAPVTVLDYSQQQVSLRFQIDGQWHAGQAMDRETGDNLLAVLKKIAGLEYRQRRARQEGKFECLYKKKKFKIRLVSQGVKTGERVAIYLDWKKPVVETLIELGMRESMIGQLTPILGSSSTGMVLATAIPGQGYTSIWRGVLDACDRLTRDYYVIEEAAVIEPEVINVVSVPFDREQGEDAMSPLEKLLLKQPDVIAFNDLPDAETIDGAVNLSNAEEIPVFLRSPGKHALDAILRLVALKPDVEQFIDRLNAIVAMRLIRKLCQNCRVGYTPHPALIQKLGLPPGRIAQLYKPFVYKPGMLDEDENELTPCPDCHGIGYAGRTGLFELLILTDDLRNAIMQTPQLNQLTTIAQQAGHVSIQQEGIVLVAKGLTSIDELQRILKA